MIVIDRSALKAKYGGILLSTCALDANNSIFPLAFGVVDSENDASWEWVYNKLRESFSRREHLAIVAHRHISIKKVVSKVYLEADFGICTHHLWTNLTSKFKKLRVV